MQKVKILNKEYQVEDALMPDAILVYLNGYEELEELETLLKADRSLVRVEVWQEIEMMEGEPEPEETYELVNVYTDMKLLHPVFQSVERSEKKVKAVFGLRPITEKERQKEKMQTAITYLSDEQALTVKELYPEWSEKSVAYKLGSRVLYADTIYKCIGDHTSQSDWMPDKAPSLWTKVLSGQSGEIGKWEQSGSENGYAKGDKVTHNGETWESLVDNNVWEPGIIGTEGQWKEVV